ncbi:hypothetical protein TUZN_0010 [Thermoproteus uzoniensis 768-20]|uniref:Uncharacterized protein n=1 Tax=Thermoproteus uzoniensis (strain 768-20) TaxID=999630 RepID=F2L0N7_THEU7|nr:hypothetical protein [Thermoproteus uzoniensis]AEA11516.1 hypothetical protein TUZN_0010 [Thermoproteus uzoniensis 768-20]
MSSKKRILLALLIILSLSGFISGQITSNYIIIFSSIILFMFTIAIMTYIRNLNALLFAFVGWSIALWLSYFFILSPLWIAANEDLNYMNAVVNKIIENGHYPFNDNLLLIVRPNYVLYPTSFIIQAMLSTVTSLAPEILAYSVPVVMYVAYFINITITILILKKNRDKTLDLFVHIPSLSFINIVIFLYFVYSNVIRSLIFLLIYVLYVIYLNKGDAQSFFLLIVLSIAIVVGHSQEPITMLLLLSIYLFYSFVFSSNRNKEMFNRYVKFYIVYLMIFISYSLYIAITVTHEIVNLLQNIFMLLYKSSMESFETKLSVAQSVLTPWETTLLVISFSITSFYIFSVLILHFIRSLKDNSLINLANIFTILTYGTLSLLPLIIPSILSDLFFRPFWVLATFLAIYPYIYNHNMIRHESLSRKQLSKFRRPLIGIIVIITVTLYGIFGIVYNRIHLMSSEVYVHEAETINYIYSGLSKLTEKGMLGMNTLGIVDSPNQPGYEISSALILLNISKECIIFTEPFYNFYNLTYLNGIIKSRSPHMYSNNLCKMIPEYVITRATDASFDILTNVVFNMGNVIKPYGTNNWILIYLLR